VVIFFLAMFLWLEMEAGVGGISHINMALILVLDPRELA
jgi:hypothetical protein